MASPSATWKKNWKLMSTCFSDAEIRFIQKAIKQMRDEGLVKPDMSLKAWGRKFRAYAADLAQLKKPTPALPPFDFANALTADTEQLKQMHDRYVAALRRRLREARAK